MFNLSPLGKILVIDLSVIDSLYQVACNHFYSEFVECFYHKVCSTHLLLGSSKE